MFGNKTLEALIYVDSYCNILVYDSISLVDGYQPVGGTFCFHSVSSLAKPSLLTTILKQCQY
jgi:hypothetical protein